MRSCSTGAHSEVGSHGVPGAGEGVGQGVETPRHPGVDPPHDVPLEPGD